MYAISGSFWLSFWVSSQFSELCDFVGIFCTWNQIYNFFNKIKLWICTGRIKACLTPFLKKKVDRRLINSRWPIKLHVKGRLSVFFHHSKILLPSFVEIGRYMETQIEHMNFQCFSRKKKSAQKNCGLWQRSLVSPAEQSFRTIAYMNFGNDLFSH